MNALAIDKAQVVKSLSKPVHEVLARTAIYEVLREKCDKIQQALLDSGRYGQIRDLNDTFLMAPEDQAKYYPALDAAYKAAGYDMKPGYCPALVAETEKVRAERTLVDAGKPFFGFDADQIMCSRDGMKNYKEAIRLLIGLVIAGERDMKGLRK